MSFEKPCTNNNFLVLHVNILRYSFKYFTGTHFGNSELSDIDYAKELYHAPFAVLSHNTETDPIFNYANLTAQKLFEFPWKEITKLPSRLSAESVNQADRNKLLTKVTENGFICNYSGIRISKTDRRFKIKNGTVWNLIDNEGRHYGQAATFDNCND
ncbi:MAG: MEKHLA domain-containing protein [bacterium]|nr:MEKHLA domain-containing protein [bacterium]